MVILMSIPSLYKLCVKEIALNYPDIVCPKPFDEFLTPDIAEGVFLNFKESLLETGFCTWRDTAILKLDEYPKDDKFKKAVKETNELWQIGGSTRDRIHNLYFRLEIALPTTHKPGPCLCNL